MTKTEIALRDPKNPLTFVEQKGDRYNYIVDGEVFAWNVDFETLISIWGERYRQERENKKVY